MTLLQELQQDLQNSKDIEKLKLFYKSLVYSYRQDNNFNVLKLDAILNKDIRLQEIAFQMAFILYNSFNNNKKIQNDIFKVHPETNCFAFAAYHVDISVEKKQDCFNQ